MFMTRGGKFAEYIYPENVPQTVTEGGFNQHTHLEVRRRDAATRKHAVECKNVSPAARYRIWVQVCSNFGFG